MQPGTKRTITKMLWTFPKALLLTNYMEEERVETDLCPRVWKIEVEIDPTRGRDDFFPRGHVNFYMVGDDRYWSHVSDWLFSKIKGGATSSLHVASPHARNRRFQASFKRVKNQNDTITAMKLCVELFHLFGLAVTERPEISQHTLVLESYSHADGPRWVNFGEKLWSNLFRRQNDGWIPNGSSNEANARSFLRSTEVSR